jgi:ankyrin repeat protein
VVRRVIERGIDLASRDYRGQTALHLAAMLDSDELAILLIESGAPLAGPATLVGSRR